MYHSRHRIARCRIALFLAPFVLCSGIAGAQRTFTFETIVLEGDDVPGVGLVTTINNLAVNDAGSTLVEADTDNADTNTDSVLLLDGALYLREGDPLAEPVGATLDSFDTVNLNNAGDSGWNFFLDGTQGLNDDSGIYRNTSLLIQEGELSTAPELSPGTPYIGFFEAKINNAGSILIMASVDDAAIDTSVDRALVVLTLDEAGNLVSESVVAKESDVLPGQTEAVTDFETGPHNFDYNDAGQVLFVAELAGDAARDRAVYLDDTILAQEGDPSPVAGRLWSSLSTPEISLNNLGDTVISGSLDGDTGSNLLIALNGAKLVQEGDSLPEISPFVFTSFGSGPVIVSDAGSVLWYGDWDDADTDVDTGLFLDQQLVVQEGVTMIDGLLVDTLSGVQDGYAMSDDGGTILFEATLEGGLNGAFRVTVEEGGLQLAAPDPGIAGQINDLVATGATSGANVAFLAGVAPGVTQIPCGGAVDLAAPRLLGVARADVDGTATLSTLIPMGAEGRTLLFQAVEPGVCGVSNLVSTDF